MTVPSGPAGGPGGPDGPIPGEQQGGAARPAEPPTRGTPAEGRRYDGYGDYPPSAGPGQTVPGGPHLGGPQPGDPPHQDPGVHGGQYRPAPGYGAYVEPGQAFPAHPVPGPPHPDNDPQALRRRAVRRSAVGVLIRPGRPWLTYTVMGLLVAVYLLQRATEGSGDVVDTLIYWPAVTWFEPWRMLTTVVLHGSIGHLAFNVYALWIAGQALEPTVGRWRLAVLMLASALGGSVAVLLLSGGPGDIGWRTAVVGFSGAVMGLFGAILSIQRSIGQENTQLLVLLGINIAIGFVPGWNISWEAHLGGMVVGVVLGFVWSTWRERRPTLVAAVSSGLVAAALVAAVQVYRTVV